LISGFLQMKWRLLMVPPGASIEMMFEV